MACDAESVGHYLGNTGVLETSGRYRYAEWPAAGMELRGHDCRSVEESDETAWDWRETVKTMLAYAFLAGAVSMLMAVCIFGGMQ